MPSAAVNAPELLQKGGGPGQRTFSLDCCASKSVHSPSLRIHRALVFEGPSEAFCGVERMGKPKELLRVETVSRGNLPELHALCCVRGSEGRALTEDSAPSAAVNGEN